MTVEYHACNIWDGTLGDEQFATAFAKHGYRLVAVARHRRYTRLYFERPATGATAGGARRE